MGSKPSSNRAAMRAARATLAAACIASGVSLPAAAQAASGASAPNSVRAYYERLRSQLHWTTVRVGKHQVQTPDAKSRVLLARAAAERAGLAEVGLDYRDVYGVISAETSWVPRDGLGRNGVTSEGLAQLEPATARALGVRNANDPVEAVHAAATLLKEAAQWSARRIAGLRLAGAERAARLREGISIYYNLSSEARARWNGIAHPDLPVETKRHIANVRAGARQAERLAGGTTALPPVPRAAAVQRVSGTTKQVPRVVGTIEWSGGGSDADSRRAGRHVVWSDGKVTREAGGRVRWTSGTPGADRNG